MIDFVRDNWITAVTLLVLSGVVFLAVRRIIVDKKNSTCSCGHNCAGCNLCQGKKN